MDTKALPYGCGGRNAPTGGTMPDPHSQSHTHSGDVELGGGRVGSPRVRDWSVLLCVGGMGFVCACVCCLECPEWGWGGGGDVARRGWCLGLEVRVGAHGGTPVNIVVGRHMVPDFALRHGPEGAVATWGYGEKAPMTMGSS